MLNDLIQLYTTAMAHDVRSPMPHLVGPPGTGKSTMVQQLADLLGVQLHIVNVNRLSPLELEGLQMPVDDNTRIHMIPAVFWSRLQAGDIVLFDEYLRGFPEVQDGLLDILTSRRAGAFQLPKVFFIGASNTVVAYDKALEDRLLHIPVPDIRKRQGELKRIKKLFVEATGMDQQMVDSYEMKDLFEAEVLPMYEMLDAFTNRSSLAAAEVKGTSVRHLIGQVQLRRVVTPLLKDLIAINNSIAVGNAHWQNIILLDGKVPSSTVTKLRSLKDHPKLSAIQRINVDLNLQMIDLHKAMRGVEDDEPDVFA